MKDSLQREAARQFAAEWSGHGYEKAESAIVAHLLRLYQAPTAQ